MAQHTNILRGAIAAVAGSAALALSALPAAAQQPAPPSYAVHGEETIHGTVRSIDGKYSVTVRDDRGFVDNVRLHDGTVINPTGLQLASGQAVTIFGRADGSAFVANEIDTPYQTVVAPGYYPYGYGYGYGPRYRVGLGFGGWGGYGRFGFRG